MQLHSGQGPRTMPTILFAAREDIWNVWQQPLSRALAEAGLEARLLAAADPAQVDYLIVGPGGPVTDFGPFGRAKAVLSLWAGVERLTANTTLSQPLLRMVDPGLTEGMVEYVTGHVLRHHLGMDPQIRGLQGEWRKVVPPLARDRHVGILGLGALGAAAGHALSGLGFRVSGWSRRPKDLPDLTCRSGEAGLAETLAGAGILVLLLPLTPATERLMDTARLDLLPQGAVLINPGRGGLIDDAALLAALDRGQVGHATLDTFRIEPLPADHAFWSHPKVTVTPHIAAATRPESASRVLAENMRRGEAGEPFLHLVDRRAGY